MRVRSGDKPNVRRRNRLARIANFGLGTIDNPLGPRLSALSPEQSVTYVSGMDLHGHGLYLTRASHGCTSISPGRHDLSNHDSPGPYNRKITLQPLVGTVWIQLLS